MVLLSLWATRKVDGISSFKISLDCHFATNVFKMFTEPLCVGNHHLDISVLLAVNVLFVVLVVGVVLVVILDFEPSEGQLGNLHIGKTPLMCSFSFCSTCWFVQTVLAFWEGCRKHCTWQKGCGGCPSEGTGLCV